MEIRRARSRVISGASGNCSNWPESSIPTTRPSAVTRICSETLLRSNSYWRVFLSIRFLLAHSSVKITEKHYAPWVKARQEQMEANVQRAWFHEPIEGAQNVPLAKGSKRMQ